MDEKKKIHSEYGEVNVGEWICAHILIHFGSSWVRKKDGKLKKQPFWGVVEKITHFDLPKHQQQQLHFFSQHGRSSSKDSHQPH